MSSSLARPANFNPRPPCGGRRGGAHAVSPGADFNPRPPCGGRRHDLVLLSAPSISIHVPRAGDDELGQRGGWLINISIHVPRAGDDHGEGGARIAARLFQSTSPVRGTTMGIHAAQRRRSDFNPRPPCGGRRCPPACTGAPRSISIHVPRAGDDSYCIYAISIAPSISIHVPRAGDDPHPSPGWNLDAHFNPRPPCGGRRQNDINWDSISHFNPRPPCGGRPVDLRLDI